jgi:hypothetical protein
MKLHGELDRVSFKLQDEFKKLLLSSLVSVLLESKILFQTSLSSCSSRLRVARNTFRFHQDQNIIMMKEHADCLSGVKG